MRILYSHRIQSRDGQSVHVEQMVAAAYERGDIDKQKVADDLIHMWQVIRADEKRDDDDDCHHKLDGVGAMQLQPAQARGCRLNKAILL